MTPRTIRIEKNFNLKMLRNALKRVSGKNMGERVEILEKAQLFLRSVRQGISSRAGGELTRGNKANFDALKKVLNAYDKELQKIDRAIKFIKRNPNLTIQKAIEEAKKSIRLRSIRGRMKKLEDLKNKIEVPLRDRVNKGSGSRTTRVGGNRNTRNQQNNKKKKFYNKNKTQKTSTIIKEGDNFIALNLPSSPTIRGGGSVDPYTSSLNTYKINGHLTV